MNFKKYRELNFDWILNGLMVLLILYAECISAQNLIPNPSFEEVYNTRNRWSGTHTHFNNNIAAWNSPTQGSPDILKTEYLGEMHPARPQVFLDHHRPRTGDIMIGIKTHGCNTHTLHCKEYVQVPLLEPLMEGEQYYFEYYLLPISTSPWVNSFGIYLTMNSFEDRWIQGLLKKEPMVMDEEVIGNKERTWVKISGTFIADSAYTQVILGNFASEEDIEINRGFAQIDYGYYLLDDVFLEHRPRRGAPIVANKVITIDHLYFDYDKTELKDIEMTNLGEVLDYMKKHPNSNIKITGHTDNAGTEEYNNALSEKRAQAVASYLVKQGIVADRITCVGKGYTEPMDLSNTKSARQKNRRVEMIISQ